MKYILFVVLTITFLTACVSKTEYQEILDENTALKSEIEELKFGAPILLKEGKKFFESKDFKSARGKFNTLIERHSDSPEALECKDYLAVIDEEELWQSANDSKDISNVISYIEKFPDGKYIDQAKSQNEKLKILNMGKAYEIAEQRNTSSAWKEFLSEYPSHKNAQGIEKKIIKLEVDEIYRNSETGKMPSFQKNNYGNSASSTVKITNNTGCELVVRYSGTDIKMITIPEGSTRSVSLSSGSYRVAASACGENYAGSENLTGEYTSTFYISTSLY